MPGLVRSIKKEKFYSLAEKLFLRSVRRWRCDACIRFYLSFDANDLGTAFRVRHHRNCFLKIPYPLGIVFYFDNRRFSRFNRLFWRSRYGTSAGSGGTLNDQRFFPGIFDLELTFSVGLVFNSSVIERLGIEGDFRSIRVIVDL